MRSKGGRGKGGKKGREKREIIRRIPFTTLFLSLTRAFSWGKREKKKKKRKMSKRSLFFGKKIHRKGREREKKKIRVLSLLIPR